MAGQQIHMIGCWKFKYKPVFYKKLSKIASLGDFLLNMEKNFLF